MIDVVPVGPGLWLARCECGATEKFPDAEAGWTWVLAHPCPETATTGIADVETLIDLTGSDRDHIPHE